MFQSDLYELGNKINKRELILKSLKDDGCVVIVYGSGKFGVAAAEMCIKNGIKIGAFLEPAQYYYAGKNILLDGERYDCINDELLNELDYSFNMLLGVIDYSLLSNLKRKYTNCHIVEYLDAYEPHIITGNYIKKNLGMLNEIYNALVDKESRDVLYQYIYARYTGDVTLLSNLKHDDNYLYDWELLNLNKNDIVLDGGAFDGDTIKEIINFVGEIPKKIFAFEPDINNLTKLKNNISDNFNHIFTVQAGLYCKDAELRFNNDGTLGSSIDENGRCIVKVQGIDEHEEYMNVTIIKMDIEGSELDALHGAYNLLKKEKPRLAICIYHKNDDIIDIYNYLKQFDYKFYLRQHSSSVEETVLYAI